MITNKLLQEKWKAQAQIALEADHDLYKIAEKAHDIVLKMFKSKKLNIPQDAQPNRPSICNFVILAVN